MTRRERLPTPEEFEAALAKVREGRNPARFDPKDDPTVPPWLTEFSADVQAATTKAIRAYLAWREKPPETPLARRTQTPSAGR